MSKITLLGNSPLERAQVDQWLEYIQRELGSHFKHGMSTKGALEVGSDQMEPGIWFLYPVVQSFTINSFLFTEITTLCMSAIDAHAGTCIPQRIGKINAFWESNISAQSLTTLKRFPHFWFIFSK